MRRTRMRMLACTLFVFSAFCFQTGKGEGSFAASFVYTPVDSWNPERLIAFYKSESLQLSFNEANEYCKAYKGGSLVKINEQQLQTPITEQLSNWVGDVSESLGNKAAYWGGATGNQYTWYWIDSGGYIPNPGETNQNWEDGEPQCTSGSCYLRISAQNTTLGEWFAENAPNTDGWGSYICQMDPCDPPCTGCKWCVAESSNQSCQIRDPCEHGACLNGGTCNSTGCDYTCQCTEGYIGESCETYVCSPGTCQNNASCEVNGFEFICHCLEGYKGDYCEYGPCFENPCGDGGDCVVTGATYVCDCFSEYDGEHCELAPCSESPCKNGGNCIADGENYICECSEEFAGSNCELEPCSEMPCQNGGTCSVSENTYQCQCVETFAGKSCEYEVCSGNDCQNNGTCIKIDDSTTGCECVEGYTGALCELEYCNQDECSSNGICISDGSSNTCNCTKGYSGNTCQFASCLISGCKNNGTCKENVEMFFCQCTEGYSGDSCETVVSPLEWWIWIIVGVGGFLIICIIVATMFLLRRKGCCQKSKVPNSPSTFALGDVEVNTYAEIEETYVIPASVMLPRYKELTRNDCVKLRKQFENELSTASLLLKSATTAGQLKENRRNNRMGSILPYDFNRVILSSQGSSYINASFINGFSTKQKFIATQAPLPSTVGDFWGMIWEQKSRIVVMLNSLIENDNIVCDKYWPQLSYSTRYGSVNVRTIEEKLMSGYVMRKMEICLQNDVLYKSVIKIVTHLHLLDWPEGSVPLSTSGIVRLHGHMQRASLNQKVDSPIVVHCSNGTGRTGTFIAYDYLVEEMREKMSVDCFECVRQLRGQRMGMVKSEDEYILLHKLVTEAHELGDTDTDLKDVEKKLKRMTRRLSYINRESEYETEYNKLDLIKPLLTTQEVAKMEKNVHKNFTIKVLPYDHSRLALPPMRSDPNPVYYNATILNVSCFTGVTIAAQGPTYDTLVEFWHAVWHSRISTIIMLSKAGDNKKCVTYWPVTVGQPATFGDVTVTLMKEKGEQIVERNFALNFYSERHDILHLQVSDWTERIDENNAVLDLIDYLQQNSQIGNGTLLIHCNDGAGRTGTFISILELMSRAKREGRVDILRTVKDLRDRRPGMVSSISQYRFLYEVMRDYAAWVERSGNKRDEQED